MQRERGRVGGHRPAMPAAAAPSPRQFSLGITLDPCADGLQVKTIDRRGALGRTGRVVRARDSVPPRATRRACCRAGYRAGYRAGCCAPLKNSRVAQYEDDVIIAINDVSVLGKDTAELAALIHDGQNWYSGLDSVSTVTILGGGGPADGVVPQGQHPAAARGKKLTVVVTHLDSDVTERRPTAAPQRAGRVDLIEPRPVPADAVCSDSVGAQTSVFACVPAVAVASSSRTEHSGRRRRARLTCRTALLRPLLYSITLLYLLPRICSTYTITATTCRVC